MDGDEMVRRARANDVRVKRDIGNDGDDGDGKDKDSVRTLAIFVQTTPRKDSCGAETHPERRWRYTSRPNHAFPAAIDPPVAHSL